MIFPANRIARRELLAGAAVNVLLLAVPTAFADARSLDLSRFLRLSEKLTARPNLPPEIGRMYLQNIVGDEGLRKRWENARGSTTDERAALESRIVADWCSGQTLTPKGLVCIDYAGALLWDAIGFARPRGVPDAEAGRWALAPS
ncbi:sugar dehydrogenase complex small subunit [Methylocystis sp. IM3]|uniref:sugar dehydrogenase complex small subunit n=2 Tax=unclassified Methylocystis TaxID=2625913 RepID=UPI0031195C88